MAHIEKRAAGRWRARYRGPDGRERSKTFDRKVDAERWLAGVEVEKARGQWVDPAAGKVTFETWFDDWLRTLAVRPRTRELYEYLGRVHLKPTFGRMELAKITATDVRRWRASKLGSKLSPNTVAKGYRLLKQTLDVAVDEGVIGRNPCNIKGASTERTAEIRFATVEDVWAIADAIRPEYRAMVLVEALATLRWGELAGLRRRHVDLLHRTITVATKLDEMSSGQLDESEPKTEAGRRTIALPQVLVDELERHLEEYAQAGPAGLVFPSPDGSLLRRSNFRRRVWAPAAIKAGLSVDVPDPKRPGKTKTVPSVRFHDLRHTAGTLTAIAGATTKELMARMGHASPRAALIYQHATAERDEAIAVALDALAASPRPEQVADVVPIGAAGA